LISNDTYQSYLLRFWRDSPHSAWRAALQSTATNEKYVFAETDALFEFLDRQLCIDADHADDDAQGGVDDAAM